MLQYQDESINKDIEIENLKATIIQLNQQITQGNEQLASIQQLYAGEWMTVEESNKTIQKQHKEITDRENTITQLMNDKEKIERFNTEIKEKKLQHLRSIDYIYEIVENLPENKIAKEIEDYLVTQYLQIND